MAKKGTVTYELEAMEVGNEVSFPAEKYNSATSMASVLGFKLDRKYKTETCRQTKTITVTRIA